MALKGLRFVAHSGFAVVLWMCYMDGPILLVFELYWVDWSRCSALLHQRLD